MLCFTFGSRRACSSAVRAGTRNLVFSLLTLIVPSTECGQWRQRATISDGHNVNTMSMTRVEDTGNDGQAFANHHARARACAILVTKGDDSVHPIISSTRQTRGAPERLWRWPSTRKTPLNVPGSRDMTSGTLFPSHSRSKSSHYFLVFTPSTP